MKSLSVAITAFGLLLPTLVQAQQGSLVGTWSTKSRKVLTGPGFYNPVEDRLIEPELTGISYSFTADGFFESAWYRAVSNPVRPSCVQGVMQWQHGTYTLPDNGSIVLQPIAVDGRELTSTPCQYDNSVYSRYYQAEMMEKYSIEIDKFHNVPRLNLFHFDGSPQQPLYLVYNPPQMLPTQTLNPTAAPSATGKAKRDAQVLLQSNEPLNKNAIIHRSEPFDVDKIWWAGIGLVAVGSAMYMYPSTK
ncbi:Reversal of tor2 lethality [Knufia obscura]|uniref:Protein ROT1 n=1 Tax=Knufia obscura TaxID=1635080 RepID=A0ABR0RFE2_9EURO|nr:Reversal of tor2 lethality [Knufia obscura]